MTVVKHPRSQRRDSIRKNKAILNAARTLFLDAGFSATNMDQVARAANVSKPTVYSHFGSKEDLFLALLKELCLDALPADLAAIAHSDMPFEARFVEMGFVFLRHVFSDEQIRLFREMVSESRDASEIGRMMFEGPILRSRIEMRDFLARAAADGEISIDNPDLAARMILGMFKTDVHMSLLLGQKTDTSEAALRATVRRCVVVFLHGVQT